MFDCPVDKVWNALSQESALKKWYFQVENYQFENGKEFTFYAGEDERVFLHKCQFINIVPLQTIEYTWAHPNNSKGTSIVKWKLEAKDEKTLVTLIHTGIESFSDAGSKFSKENYEMGWNVIVKTMLRNYLYGIEKLTFEIEINSSPAQLWKILWDKKSYTDWAASFSEGSYYTGKLNQGERIHFLVPSGEGMYSDVATLKENQLMIFKHIGMMKYNEELPIDSETEKWTGCSESYKIIPIENNKSILKVEVDAIENYKEFMKSAFPIALQKIKIISELQNP